MTEGGAREERTEEGAREEPGEGEDGRWPMVELIEGGAMVEEWHDDSRGTTDGGGEGGGGARSRDGEPMRQGNGEDPSALYLCGGIAAGHDKKKTDR